MLMGPGPSEVSPRVLAALARPTIGHLDPEFVRMMDEVKYLLQYAFRTQNPLTIPISGPGSAAMEASLANLLEPGDVAIVCVNGVFGTRMVENVRRMRGMPIVVADEWGSPVDPEKVEAALKANPGARLLAFVHAETSTGVRSDAALLCALARQYGVLSLVDAVTSLGGIDVDVDGWGADAVYAGSQKCLSSPPGISPLTMSPAAARRIRDRTSPVQSWFLDLNLVMGYWGGDGARAYHHTAPVNALYGLHEALVMLREEGLERAWARHAGQHRLLKDGIEALGLSYLVPEPNRLPQLNAVRVPEHVDEALVRRALLSGYGIEIGAGLGALAGKIWRIGIMGHGANPRNVTTLLSALRPLLT
jgi:alanine-glyoxylate transaminase / serine-glyoxylate transaminase / serine-pyruvate transaminase